MNIVESNTWEPVRQWEITDPALGGTNGVMNTPIKSLVNRTAWLKAILQGIIAGTQSIVGRLINGSTVANEYSRVYQADLAIANTEFVQNAISARTGRRNAIINGDMRVCSRGTQFHIDQGESRYTLDRWFASLTAGSRSAQFYQDLDSHRTLVPATSSSLRIVLSAGTGIFNLKQRIENAWTFEGGQAILQFCCNVSVNCDLTIKLSQFLSQSQIDSGNAESTTSVTIPLAAGFQKVIQQFDLPRLDQIDLSHVDNSNCLELSLEIQNQADVIVWLTNVQLESGMIASLFEVRDDTQACLRYFEKQSLYEGYDDCQYGGQRFSVYRRQFYSPKRRRPTLTKENIELTNLDVLSELSRITPSACTIEFRPTSFNYSEHVQRSISLDLLIDAEIY